MFSTEDGGGELTQHGGLQVAEGLVHDVVELRLVVEGQTPNADFRQQVVFVHFTPAVVVVVVEGAIKAGIVHVGRQLVLIALLCPAIEATVGDDAHVTAEAHHLDAVVFVFLNDVVADLLLFVTALHGGVDVFQGNDAGADALVVVKVEVFAEVFNPFRFGDDEHVVTTDVAAALAIGVEEVGILCQTLQRSFVFGGEPQLAAMVVAAHGGLNGHRHRPGVADLTRGRHIAQRREAADSHRNTIQVLRVDTAMTCCGISRF